MVTTITRETSSGTYTHVIDIAGVTGALLWTLLSGTVLFMLAYSTNAWIRRDYDMGDLSSGLWQSCLCADIAGDDAAGWQIAVQTLATIAMVSMFLCGTLVLIYIYIHSFNKNLVLWLILISAVIATCVLLSAIILYGVKTVSDQSYSYVFAVFATLFALIATIFTCLQMRRSGMMGGQQPEKATDAYGVHYN